MRPHSLLRVVAAALVAAACGGDGPVGPPADPPTKLSVGVQPSAAAQNGVALAVQPSVRLRDASNRLVAQAGIVVTATVTGSVTLSNGTATTDGTGTATFSGLTVTGLIGTYTLHFSAASLTGVDATPLALAAGAPSQLALSTSPSAASQAGVALAAQPVVQLRDVSSNAAAQAGVTVTATLVSGSPNLSNASVQTDATGRATFSGLTLAGATGSYTLRFSATGLTPADAPAATVLAAGPPTQLALATQPPATVVNGAVFPTQPAVQLRDAFGNNATAAGVVVLASIVTGPAGAAIAGDTAMTDATGKATYAALKITGTAGNYSLRFASAPLSSVVSAAPTALTAGAGTQLGLSTQPSTVAQNGAALATQPVVQVLDQSQNAAAQAGVLVTASFATGTGTLANATSTTDATGKATFSGLAINGVIGLYQLRFGAPALTAVNALSTLLNAGTASALGITTQPATTAANATVLSRQPVVRLLDGSGNAVSQTGVVVTATVVSGSLVLASAAATTNAQGIATFAGLAMTGLAGNYTFQFTSPSLTPATATTPTALGIGAPAQLSVTVQPATSATVAIALATQPVVLVADAGGNAVPNATVTASVSGVTVLNGSAIANGSGSAAFAGLTMVGTAATYTIQFGSGAAQVGASAGTMLVPGAPAAVQIAIPPPAQAQSGVPFATAPAVDVRDAGGNLLGGVLVYAEAPGNPATVVMTNGSAVTSGSGRATFTGLTLTAPVSGYSLRFCVGAVCSLSSLKVGSPTPTSLVTGPLAQVSVTSQPGTAAVNGVALVVQPVVRVADAADNPVAGASVTATTSAGTVVSGASAISDAAGDAVFTGLTLTGAVGSYTLHFASAPGSDDAAAPTVVTPGAPATITITTQPPANATNGLVFAQQPVVTVSDASGNLVPGVAVVATTTAGATLSNATATTSGLGVATFSMIGLTGTAAAYTLQFQSGAASALASPTVLGSGPATTISVPVQPSTSASNGLPLAQQPVVHVTDGTNPVAGAIVTATAGSATVVSGTASTDGAGNATFAGLTLIGPPASYTLQFATNGLAPVSASAATALGAGPASRLEVVNQPSATAASGAALAIQPVVKITDAGGTLVASGSPIVTASVVSGSATLAGASATASGGIATFSGLSLSALAGPYTLRFSSGALQSADAAAPTAVTPGAAAKLSLTTQPSSSATADSVLAQQPVVQVRDAAGNATNTAGINVTAGVVSGSPTITGVTLVPTNAQGSAAFSGLALGPAGTYRMRFTAPGLSAVNAADSLVVASPATSGQPITSLSGSISGALTQTFVVRTQPGDTLFVVTIADGPGSSGDADLYVRFGQSANIGTDVHDCFPNLAGNNEVCSFHNPAPGLWYITVYAFFAYTGVTLTATRY